MLLEEELHFMVKLPSFYSCTLYAPFTRTAHSEKKHQHASLEFIVNVVLLLWVATTIVMSCPHLTVGSSCRAPACGRGEGGFLTKECDTRLIFNDAALFHLTSNQEEWGHLVISWVRYQVKCFCGMIIWACSVVKKGSNETVKQTFYILYIYSEYRWKAFVLMVTGYKQRKKVQMSFFSVGCKIYFFLKAEKRLYLCFLTFYVFTHLQEWVNEWELKCSDIYGRKCPFFTLIWLSVTLQFHKLKQGQ